MNTKRWKGTNNCHPHHFTLEITFMYINLLWKCQTVEYFRTAWQAACKYAHIFQPNSNLQGAKLAKACFIMHNVRRRILYRSD